MKGMHVGLLIGHEGVLNDAFPLAVSNVAVVVEETIILHNLRDIPTGFALLMGTIYCLNLEYPRSMSDASTSQLLTASSPPARPPTPATSSTSRTPERVVPGKRKQSMHHQEHLAVLREMQVAEGSRGSVICRWESMRPGKRGSRKRP
ncbi:unnamed protein product [Leuciscus chuanchicus]